MGFLDRFRRKKAEEVSPGGSTIYRYEDLEDRQLQVPKEAGKYLEEIEAHFDSLFPGRESFVYHEILSDIVHIDVHVMKPTAEEPFYVVFTSGMSDRAMNIPTQFPKDKRRDLELAELFMFLPGSWDLGDAGKTARDIPTAHFWPIQFMKFLARFPHQYNTWLAYGHTVPNGAEYAPLDDSTTMGGVVLNWGDGPLGTMKAKDGRSVNFYEVVPAYKEEIEYKLKYGMEALNEKFQQAEGIHIFDPQRPNLCPDFKEILD